MLSLAGGCSGGLKPGASGTSLSPGPGQPAFDDGLGDGAGGDERAVDEARAEQGQAVVGYQPGFPDMRAVPSPDIRTVTTGVSGCAPLAAAARLSHACERGGSRVREIGVKYRVDDLEGLLSAIKSRGITVSDPLHQDDQAYAPAGWQFGDSKLGVSFLRLRTVAGRHYFTLKQPAQNERACLEYETEVRELPQVWAVAML